MAKASRNAKAVIATIAEDRPGLVSELSELVLTLDLNIEDSRMSVLGGEFAVLMSVSGDPLNLATLNERLEAQSSGAGFAYLYRATGERTEHEQRPFQVTVEAMDHPGIVSGVTGFFSERSVNIRELATDNERAAHTGTLIFNLRMEIEVPADEPVGPLKEAFNRYCEREGLDGDLIAPQGTSNSPR